MQSGFRNGRLVMNADERKDYVSIGWSENTEATECCIYSHLVLEKESL